MVKEALKIKIRNDNSNPLFLEEGKADLKKKNSVVAGGGGLFHFRLLSKYSRRFWHRGKERLARKVNCKTNMKKEDGK